MSSGEGSPRVSHVLICLFLAGVMKCDEIQKENVIAPENEFVDVNYPRFRQTPQFVESSGSAFTILPDDTPQDSNMFESSIASHTANVQENGITLKTRSTPISESTPQTRSTLRRTLNQMLEMQLYYRHLMINSLLSETQIENLRRMQVVINNLRWMLRNSPANEDQQ